MPRNKCNEYNCNTVAFFNYEGSHNDGLYCSKHKRDMMIDVVTKKCIYHECIYHECRKVPSFNYVGQTSRIYCSTHKMPGMVFIN